MVSVTTPYLKDINLALVISCLCSCLQELDCHILPAKYSVESFCLFPQVNICSWWRRRRKTCGKSFVALEILHERWSTKKTWEPLVPTPSHYMSRVFKQELGGGGRGWGRDVLGILGGDVPPGSPTPDPVSDQKLSFSPPVFRPLSGCSNAIQRINYVLTLLFSG